MASWESGSRPGYSGPTRNIILIETGQAALGLITMGIGFEAWNGTGEWTKGTPLPRHARDPAIDVRFTVYDRGAETSGSEIAEQSSPASGSAPARAPEPAAPTSPQDFRSARRSGPSSPTVPWKRRHLRVIEGQLDGVVVWQPALPVPALLK